MTEQPASFDDHPCLSAVASCSGLVPCEPCRVALSAHVIPKALHAVAVSLEAGADPAAQVTAYLDAFAQARRALVDNIRLAAIAHEAQLAATRAAFDTAPPPKVAKKASTQTAPIKPKRRTPASVAAEVETLDHLFAQAATPSASASTSPVVGSPSTPRREEKSP